MRPTKSQSWLAVCRQPRILPEMNLCTNPPPMNRQLVLWTLLRLPQEHGPLLHLQEVQHDRLGKLEARRFKHKDAIQKLCMIADVENPRRMYSGQQQEARIHAYRSSYWASEP